MGKQIKILGLIFATLMLTGSVWAATGQKDLKVKITPLDADTNQDQAQPTKSAQAESTPNTALDKTFNQPVRYTLGPDDVIEITIMRHPEFSGTFPINLEGKIQFKFVGDLVVTGLTKKELEQKIQQVIGNYVINPEVNVTILEYRSKVIYVVGEVGAPGKYFMRADAIPVREAVVAAGLPTLAAAMRRCRLVTPEKHSNGKIKNVDLYAILYGGNLKDNLDMSNGDVLYVPATIMSKIVRVISPVTNTVGTIASGPSSVQSGRDASSALLTKAP